ncbi:hypothetical protein, partial [Xenorhabdus bovienii]|uniref:hypothetical protein n=1 Tax=Xenorhabdus bovienii TaxID=40576 RepID=UPI000570D6F5
PCVNRKGFGGIHSGGDGSGSIGGGCNNASLSNSLTRNAFKRLHYPVDIIAQESIKILGALR